MRKKTTTTTKTGDNPIVKEVIESWNIYLLLQSEECAHARADELLADLEMRR